jgi:hypothetical protein
MKLRTNISLSNEILFARKLRTFLSIIGIAVGVAAVVLMVAAGRGAEQTIINRVRSMGTDLIVITAGQTQIIAGRPRQISTVKTLLPKDAAAILDECPSVALAAPVQSKQSTIRWEDRTATTTVLGTTPAGFLIRNITLLEAVILAGTGGGLGVLLGVGSAWAVSALTGWPTIISWPSALIALAFSAVLGMCFGIYPASRAASLETDPSFAGGIRFRFGCLRYSIVGICLIRLEQVRPMGLPGGVTSDRANPIWTLQKSSLTPSTDDRTWIFFYSDSYAKFPKSIFYMNASPENRRPEEPEEVLKRFVAEKAACAKELAQAEGKEMLPEFQHFFAAAQQGNWAAAKAIFNDLLDRIRRGDTRAPENYCRHGSQWSTVFEIGSALEQLMAHDSPHLVAIGKEIVASIPLGSIYFGGTDAGRLVITAMSRSHLNGEPFFTLTQNSLVDKGYLAYLRSIYGHRISLPSEEDQTTAFKSYAEDFQRRRQENKPNPCETIVEEEEGQIRFINQVSFMTMNGLLAKMILDRNPGRQVFIEESFPIEWMRPHLAPHALIMKIYREPMPEISSETIEKNNQYWFRFIQPLLGAWFRQNMPLREMAALVEKLETSPTQTGSSPQFIKSSRAQMWLSKLRSAIAGIYSWRARIADHHAEKERMLEATECAFGQAWALCPRSPEALFGYASLLMDQGKEKDALLITEISRKLAPENQIPGTLETEIKRRMDRN